MPLIKSAGITSSRFISFRNDLNMLSGGNIQLMDEFPDFKVPGFNEESYNRRFRESNVLIHAKAKQVFYPEHWGPVSIKCAFQGNEFYEVGRCRYRVDDQSFLLLNEGQTYRSFIDADTPVESFTVNFSPQFVREVSAGRGSMAFPENLPEQPETVFCERLYMHDKPVSPHLLLLRELSRDFHQNRERIEELFFLLLNALFHLKERESGQIKKVKAVKASTRRELYQRLMRVKDHIESCYAEDVSLDTLAAASYLNASYLLRQFKMYFRLTPRQYAIRKRLAMAEQLLKTTDLPIKEVCYRVGYHDLTSFSRLFRQFYHDPPEMYRSKHSSKKSIFT